MRTKLKFILKSLLIIFLLVNIMAMFHAYKFTHFSTDIKHKTDAGRISMSDKIKMLLTGVALPRPVTKQYPDRLYTIITLQSNVKISAWEMQTPLSAKGTVVLCHGYWGRKI